MKKLLIVLIVIAVLVGGYAAIHLTNNRIRDDYLREINAIELPEEWEVLASEAECGKIRGNGNGMQYVVAKLVRGQRPEKDQYQGMFIESCEEFVEEVGSFYFKNIQSAIANQSELQDCFVLEAEKDILTMGTILDCDIRGH